MVGFFIVRQQKKKSKKANDSLVFYWITTKGRYYRDTCWGFAEGIDG